MKGALSTLAVAAAVLIVTSLPAEGHHSFAGSYDLSKQLNIKGKIVLVTLRSPHAFIYVDAEDAEGNRQRWALEAVSGPQLAQGGVRAGTYVFGDPVEVVANPARGGTTTGPEVRARLVRITRTTDGKSWSMGGQTQ